jgi:hypothetical protein
MPTKGIIALWVSYSFARPIFHTVSLPALLEAQGRDFKTDRNKRLIQA